MTDILAFAGARLGEWESTAKAAIDAFSDRRYRAQGFWAANVDDGGPSVELLHWLHPTDRPDDDPKVNIGRWGSIGHWEERFVGWEGENLDEYEDVVRHIAGRDPHSTLIEVAALRALVAPHRRIPCGVEEHGGPDFCKGDDWCEECAHPSEITGDPIGDWPCDVVKGVAAIWPKHPDYDDESWRP
ncbi:DUF6221 family protein [Frankia sp. AgW1.1]|uniref:DUF6221 family protein n=1 Tax=Frankia sp. AgW1.1 TaxID=1836971 RepID=UPI001931E098|nr:DUF6221 family protein [Frankia sp. AgW1.1]MBL7487113.1 hypothetical protein [Frankia sp. AgW1.1]